MRAAASLLLIEQSALPPILDRTALESFDRATVCTGWSVRDVLAHCAAAMTRAAAGTIRGFTSEDNEVDVEERRSWTVADVLAELYAGYELAAGAIDDAGGSLDGLGLGEWIHGGDVREPLGSSDAYTSPGSDLALELLLQRSRRMQAPGLEVAVDGVGVRFGGVVTVGRLETDLETFVRLCGGRRPDPSRYFLEGAEVADLLLFG